MNIIEDASELNLDLTFDDSMKPYASDYKPVTTRPHLKPTQSFYDRDISQSFKKNRIPLELIRPMQGKRLNGLFRNQSHNKNKQFR